MTSADNYIENSSLLEAVFKEEFERAGYTTLGTVSNGDPFGDKDLAADYRLAALVTRPKMNVCIPLAQGARATATARPASPWSGRSIEPAKAVVYTTQQKGYAKRSIRAWRNRSMRCGASLRQCRARPAGRSRLHRPDQQREAAGAPRDKASPLLGRLHRVRLLLAG